MADLARLLCEIALLGGGAALIGFYGFPKLDDWLKKYLETDVMPLLVAGAAFSYAGLALALGLSSVLGAFLAGMMLAPTAFRDELEQLLLPVRNLALPFFFFWFGATISLEKAAVPVGLLVALGGWSLVAKVAVGVYGGRQYGLSVRAAFRAGFSLGARGEFSALLAVLAPPPLRTFCGVYTLVTAVAGLALFHQAPAWARWLEARLFPPPASSLCE